LKIGHLGCSVTELTRRSARVRSRQSNDAPVTNLEGPSVLLILLGQQRQIPFVSRPSTKYPIKPGLDNRAIGTTAPHFIGVIHAKKLVVPRDATKGVLFGGFAVPGRVGTVGFYTAETRRQ
jgi:hypothetical protein